MSNPLSDAYRKAMDFIHHLTQPIGMETDPSDPNGLKKTQGDKKAKDPAIDVLKEEDDRLRGVTTTPTSK